MNLLMNRLVTLIVKSGGSLYMIGSLI